VDTKKFDQRRIDFTEWFKLVENPFDTDKVLRARDSIADVTEIHQGEYQKLTTELTRVRQSGKSRGILVTGVAGSGKSHLIARLYKMRPKDVLFFQVQALPGGKAWLKHILQCMVGDLEQPIGPEDPPTPQFITLIRHFIQGVRHELGRDDQSGFSLDTLNRALDARRRQIQKTIPDPSVGEVLAVLVNLWKWQAPSTKAKKASQIRRKTDLAIQWLKAAMIDDDDLSEIGVRENLGAHEKGGQSAYLNVLRLFGYLTAGQAPIILYFDQLDTMETDSINSLGDQLLQLIGSDAAAPNYLVVTAGVREEISKFRTEGIIKQAVADVIFKSELELPALTMDQCLKIVEKRLQDVFLPSQREILPDAAEGLFPFTKSFLERKLKGPIKPSPRRVLKIAGYIFEEIIATVSPRWLQDWPNVSPFFEGVPLPPPSPQSINGFLTVELGKKIDARRNVKLTGPIDGDLLAETIHRLLKVGVECDNLKPTVLPKGTYKKPTESFFSIATTDEGSEIAGIVINNKNHGGSMKACLNRSLEFLRRFTEGHIIILGRNSQSKKIDGWPSCVEPLTALRMTDKFAQISFDETEIITIMALDDLRREVPDLIIPASTSYDHHQVTAEEFSSFLRTTDSFLKLPFFAGVRSLLGVKKLSEPKKPSLDAENFVRARVEAKCIIAFKELVIEWANHNDRVTPTLTDQEQVERVAEILCKKGLLLSIGDGAKRILKKL